MIYILIVAAAVTVALDEMLDAAVIGAVLVFNAVVGYVQEHRAERSLEALRRLARTRARVLRDGHELEIDAAELVPGDVVLLEAGAKVPADCRVVYAAATEADESLLTGESVTVAKRPQPVDADAPVADRTSLLFMGTVLTRGHCRGAVTSTGRATELGRIAGSVERIPEARTPMQERMRRFTHIIGFGVLVVTVVGFALGLAGGEDPRELFRSMVALAVAALPEGLPIVLTVALAISVSRMAARRAIVRRLPAVETLGSCTVIGSDKTGTLTQNRMTVERIRAGSAEYALTGGGYEARGEIVQDGRPAEIEPDSAPELALTAGALCNDASIVEVDGEYETAGDPTEVALLVSAAKAGLLKDELEERLPRWAEIPFDPEQRYAATLHRAEGGSVVFVKGAPERVLEMCGASAAGGQLDRDAILARAHAMAEQGLRVLAMAYRRSDKEPHGSEVAHRDLGQLSFCGLQGMMDPPREEAIEAVRECRRAGIRTVMITGDHARTALAIARALEIAAEGDEVLTGRDLDSLDDAALDSAVGRVPVFARVSPQHKLRIVEALQRVGEVVAVTGDGVNDAPALKAADIGAAMGRSGTDVAKEAADMVITDDNFATIFAAVEEGRVAFDNVRNTTFFLISGNLAAVLVVLVSLGFQFALPLVAVQLLWFNLVTNGVQDVALAFEPGDPAVLERPPRRRGEGVISRILWERTALAGVVIAAGTLLLYLLELDQGSGEERARTVALTTLVLFSVFHVGNSRSEYLSAFAKSPLSNRFLFVGTATALALHVAAMHVPFLQAALRLEPLGLGEWAVMAAVGLTVILAVEVHKLIRRPAWRG